MSTPPAQTRTERRRARTRQNLTAAGRELIAEKGVAGLRIQDITERADVAMGSFYNYFQTKDDLVDAVVAETLEELARTSVQSDDESQDPAYGVARAARRIVRLAFDDPGFARLLINLNHAGPLFEHAMYPYARALVDRGIESGRFSTPDVDLMLNLIIGGSLSLIRGIVDGNFGEGTEVTHAEVVLRALGLDAADAAHVSRASVI
ncbi:TetR family transcriptional regulator [Gordonia pseudamarae]|jgi:AcrR family transcriptional regulator|uniref:TetR family transcriptional regulator n=1 Tax=Gordonia pseudamarae TaxID=2831662 RepID=A0ABX6IJE0_9ACTN|nr:MULTISPECIES: TetR/AcrR family transcriptional regulator [Gordonia]MBD0023177.1 helix-turn-helix transcriptional regulator [Gordonia sp. (in: high G+C Gram-positive bacteria)]QHN27111.1 TetR family transcriptional regulator [Gordonia pseudamarae]QHN36000.1 TetR family transcriptional regulator [Gordonia pseudamarae]